MTHMAVSHDTTLSVGDRIHEYLYVTNNTMSAEEIAGALNLKAEIVRRRITELKKGGLIDVVAKIRAGVRPVMVYRAI